MSKSLAENDPCPGRILADAGGGFAIGAVGGSVYHFFKGLRASPNGARLAGAMQAARMNGPKIGGSFAAFGGLFSTLNCTAVYVRQKEDPWNSIAAGAATSGLLAVRQGLRVAGRSTVMGGALFALIEGTSILANRAEQAQAQAQQNRLPVHDPNLVAAVANRVHAAQQNLPPVDDPRLAAAITNRVVDDPNFAAAVANRVHAAQQNLPPVDDPRLAAAITNRVVDDPNFAAAVANRVHAAQQNLPPVDDPTIAAGGAGFQDSGDFQGSPQRPVPTEVVGSSGDGPFRKEVEETKKSN